MIPADPATGHVHDLVGHAAPAVRSDPGDDLGDGLEVCR